MERDGGSEVGRKDCACIVLHQTRTPWTSEGEKMVNAVTETKIEYKEGTYNCRMTAAELNGVIVFSCVLQLGE